SKDMRLQAAALAAALAITWGPPSRLRSATAWHAEAQGAKAAGGPRRLAAGSGSSVSTQETPGDGIRAFLLRLERVFQLGDGAAYHALLTESADPGRADGFIDAEMFPGMTHVVIQERDRGPLAGTVPGNGYSLVVDAFEEYGDRARVSTWWLDLMRDRDAATDAEWLIADQRRVSSVENLYKLTLNPATRFTAHDLEVRDEDLKLTLAEGSVFVSDTDQGTTALVLLGKGEMSFRPA